MRFLQHPDCNRVLQTVKYQDDNGKLEVGALPVQDCLLAGVRAIASYWVPDAQERAAIASGAVIVLQVIGDNQPPLVMGVFDQEAHQAKKLLESE